ncbi:M36 family metallopeptidase [uncultured Hymenobacter sp.]|uniref:M36 family metallopeptidase n=1 Tax=uncultured Hymenobacter sp. TaxID=170016 RepID=UPI0035CBDC1F
MALTLPGAAVAQQTAPATALAAFQAKARAQGLSPADVGDVLVTNFYTDVSTGITHTYLQQRVNGLAVFNATGAVHTDRNGKVIFANQDFVPGAAARASAPTPSLTPEQAVTAAAVSLGLPRPVGLRRTVEARGADGIRFNNAGISEKDIAVRLMYARQGDRLVLVWRVGIAQLDQQHSWNAYVDAQTGRLVTKSDYVVSEAAAFGQQAFRTLARQRRQVPAFEVAARKATAAPASVLGTQAANSLTVVPVPFENPLLTPRVAVPLAPVGSRYSPLGWQVGQAPAGTFEDAYSLLSSGKQLTRGNNVAAYDDNSNPSGELESPNSNSTTASPDGGRDLTFDFPVDRTKDVRDPNNVAASVTNLFYWNNMLHDVMMAHGFDEASGNFQYKNLTVNSQGQKFGKDGDYVLAEAQDGSGRNNANMAVSPDGELSRMQMYLFSDANNNKLTIAGPAGAAGTYIFAQAQFGPSLIKKPLTGKLVLVNDGVSENGGAHACVTPFVNADAVKGNIAFVERGGCSQLATLNPRASSQFASKVQRAQANGATGVIMFDSVATPRLATFGGIDTVGLRIPAIFISGSDGFKLRAALQAGGTLNVVSAVPAPDIDGSFDNGVVSHEFGHGVTVRLTGGGTADCLNFSTGLQTMGEGWSDFFGLWMTTQPGDVGSTNRYVATYDIDTDYATGPGLRSNPYSTNMSATGNDYTYATIGSGPNQASETHDVGEIWTPVLWDLNWQFIYKYGYNPDFFSPTVGGNNKCLKLILDGCKLQVCQPGFLDGRDAILRADSATNRAANADLIWSVFARRGMGYSAKQGDRVNGLPTVNGVVEAFDISPNAKAVLLANRNGAVSGSPLEAYPNPAHDRLIVRTQLSSAAPVQVVVLDLLGKIVVPAASVPAAQMQQRGVELATSGLAAGLYVVRVTTTQGTFTTKVTVQH